MEPKGNVLIKKEFVYTTNWPSKSITLNGVVDTEKEYKEGLAGKMCTVMDISVDGEEYLVLGETKQGGAFLWMVDKRDTLAFVPVVKKFGTIMPAGLSPIDEFIELMKTMNPDGTHRKTRL
jgi:hypothetical protein